MKAGGKNGEERVGQWVKVPFFPEPERGDGKLMHA